MDQSSPNTHVPERVQGHRHATQPPPTPLLAMPTDSLIMLNEMASLKSFQTSLLKQNSAASGTSLSLVGNRHIEVKGNVTLSSSECGLSTPFTRAHAKVFVQTSDSKADSATTLLSTQVRRLRSEKTRGGNWKAKRSSTCHRRRSTLQYRLAKAMEERKEPHWKKVPELSTSVDTETSLSSDVNSYKRERRFYALKARKKAWKSDKGYAHMATTTTAKLTPQSLVLTQMKPRVLYLLQLYRQDLKDTLTLEKRPGLNSTTRAESTVDISGGANVPQPSHNTQPQTSETRHYDCHRNSVLNTESAIESHSEEEDRTVYHFPRRPQHTYQKLARAPSIPYTTNTQPQDHVTFQFPRRKPATGLRKELHIGISSVADCLRSELIRQHQYLSLGPSHLAHPAENLGVLENEMVGREDDPSDAGEVIITTDERWDCSALSPSTVRKQMLERELTPELRDSLLRDHYFAYQTGRASKKRRHPETPATTKPETPASKESSDDFFHEYFAEQLSRAW